MPYFPNRAPVMNIRKYFIILSLILCIALLNNPILAADKAETVTIQLKWLHQFQFAGYYAAIEKGFYAEEGLDVTLQQRSMETGHIDDVLEGRAEYGAANAGLLLSRLEGKPVVVLVQIFQYSPMVLLTLKESGLRTPFDLVGKKVMLDTMGFPDAPISGMLLKTLGGLDNLERVQMKFRYEDLTEGKVDATSAYITNQPFLFQAQGVEVNIIDPRDYGIDFFGDNLFATEKEIKEHPERIEKIIRAVKRGWQYALDHPEEIVDLILKKYDQSNLSRNHLMLSEQSRMQLI
jgi:two-component system sensor histidine kinase EvgS